MQIGSALCFGYAHVSTNGYADADLRMRVPIATLIEINGYSYNWRIMRVSEFRHVEDEEGHRRSCKSS